MEAAWGAAAEGTRTEKKRARGKRKKREAMTMAEKRKGFGSTLFLIIGCLMPPAVVKDAQNHS